MEDRWRLTSLPDTENSLELRVAAMSAVDPAHSRLHTHQLPEQLQIAR